MAHGAGSNLLNPGGGTDGSLNAEFAGTPLGAGPQTFESQIGPDNSYVDVWTNVASTGTTRQSDHLCVSLCSVRQRSDGLLLRSAEPFGHRSGDDDTSTSNRRAQRRTRPVSVSIQSKHFPESLSDQHGSEPAWDGQRADDDRRSEHESQLDDGDQRTYRQRDEFCLLSHGVKCHLRSDRQRHSRRQRHQFLHQIRLLHVHAILSRPRQCTAASTRYPKWIHPRTL